jgi:hypothetical protein
VFDFWSVEVEREEDNRQTTVECGMGKGFEKLL